MADLLLTTDLDSGGQDANPAFSSANPGYSISHLFTLLHQGWDRFRQEPIKLIRRSL